MFFFICVKPRLDDPRLDDPDGMLECNVPGDIYLIQPSGSSMEHAHTPGWSLFKRLAHPPSK